MLYTKLPLVILMPLHTAYPTIAPMESSPAAAISMLGMTAMHPSAGSHKCSWPNMVKHTCIAMRPAVTLCHSLTSCNMLFSTQDDGCSDSCSDECTQACTSSMWLTFCLAIATTLQLKHASDQHGGGDSRLNKTSCQSQGYGHLKQPAGQIVLSVIQAFFLLCCAAGAVQICCCM